MKFKTVGDSPFNRWRPVRPAYMERFKDRAWRLFGIKVPVDLRPEIRARFEKRKKDWHSKMLRRLIGGTLQAHAPMIIESITRDFVLARLVDEGLLKPSVFNFQGGKDGL